MQNITSAEADQNYKNQIVKFENAFKEILANFEPIPSKDEFQILGEFGQHQKIKFESSTKDNTVYFFLIEALDELRKNQKEPEKHFENLLSSMTINCSKKAKTKLNLKTTQAITSSSDKLFKAPEKGILMQKIGQKLGRILYRNMIVTKDGFGQITKKELTKMVKPVYFVDNTAELETKNQFPENQKLREQNKKTVGEVVDLKWPLKDKEHARFESRIIFIDKKSKRSRAIYFENAKECLNFKAALSNMAILEKDVNIQTKMNSFKKIWKITRAQMFYKKYLQRFFGSSDKIATVREFSGAFYNKLHMIMSPDPFETNFNPDFIAQLHKKALEVQLHQKKASTKALPQIVDSEDETELTMDDSAEDFNFDFDSLPEANLDINDFIEKFKALKFSHLYLHETIKVFNFMFTKCAKIINLSQIIIQRSDIEFENEENLLQKADIQVRVSSLPDETNVIWKPKQTLHDKMYFVYEFNTTGKVKTNQLTKFEIEISDNNSKTVLFSSTYDLISKLKTFSLKNEIVICEYFDIANEKFCAKIAFELFIVPATQETCHLTLTQELLELKYKNIAEVAASKPNFDKFKTEFWDKNYVDGKLKPKPASVYFYFNNNLPIPRNLIADKILPIRNSQKCFTHFRFVDAFRRLNEDHFEFHELFYDVSVFLKKQIKSKLTVPQELFSAVLTGLSPAERLFILQVYGAVYFDRYVNKDVKDFDFNFDRTVIGYLNSDIDEILQEEPHWKSIDIFLLKTVLFDIYLTFRSNRVSLVNVPIIIAKNSIKIAMKTIEFNKNFFEYCHIRELVRIRILMETNIKPRGEVEMISEINKAAVYFRVLLKRTAQKAYIIMNKNRNFIDFLINEITRNSFLNFMDTVVYNMYSDFKVLVSILFKMKEGSTVHRKKLKSIDVDISKMVDYLFLIYVLDQNKEFFNDNTKPETHLPKLRLACKKECQNMNAVVIDILERIELLSTSNFHVIDFIAIIDFIKMNFNEKQKVCCLLMKKIAGLGLGDNDIQIIIKESFLKNEQFKEKAKSIYATESEDDEGLSKTNKAENGNSSQSTNTENQDIFFDVLDDFNVIQHDYTEEKTPLTPLMSAEVCIAGISYDAVQMILHRINLINDLNSIYEVDFDQFKSLFSLFVTRPLSEVKLIYKLIKELFGSKPVSWTAFVQFLIFATYFHDKKKLRSQLIMFGEQLSSIFMPKTQGNILDKVAERIFDNLFSFLPNFYERVYFPNLLSSTEENHSTYVQSAVIDLDNITVDVTGVCNKHLFSYMYVTKVPGIIFGKHFANELIPIFEDLTEKGLIETNSLTEFSISLVVQVKTKIHQKDIKFRVSLGSPVLILCQRLDVVYFEDEVTDKSFIPSKTVDNLIEKLLPRFFYECRKKEANLAAFEQTLISIIFVHQNTEFMKFSGKISLTCDVRSFLTPLNWCFDPENNARSDPCQLVPVPMNIGSLFLPLDRFIVYLQALTFEHLTLEQIEWFVRVNSGNVSIKNQKDQSLKIGDSLFDILNGKSASEENEVSLFVFYE